MQAPSRPPADPSASSSAAPSPSLEVPERFGRARSRPEADRVWRLLWRRQLPRLPRRMCPAFLAGLDRAGLDPLRVPRARELSARLRDRSGWRIETVPGLLPVREFFALLRDRRFPAPDWIRSERSLGYTSEPDAFHDLFGHVPQLVEPAFGDVLSALAEAARCASDRDLERIERVYWFTIEFGLVRTAAGLRAMGAGLASSVDELTRALEVPTVDRCAFTLSAASGRTFQTDRPQETYFVVPSLLELGSELAHWPRASGAGASASGGTG